MLCINLIGLPGTQIFGQTLLGCIYEGIFRILTFKSIDECDQDGRVRGLETNWRLAESLLYNQSYKKDSHKTEQKGKRNDQARTCAPEGGLRRKGRLHGQSTSPGSEQFQSHIVQHREIEPPWLVGLTGLLKEAWTLFMPACWPERKVGQRKQIEDSTSSWVAAYVLTLMCTPAWDEWILQPHLPHITAPRWSKGCQDRGKILAMEWRGDLDRRWHQRKIGTTITGTYREDTLGAVQISDSSWTSQSNPNTHPDTMGAPLALWCSSTLGQR